MKLRILQNFFIAICTVAIVLLIMASATDVFGQTYQLSPTPKFQFFNDSTAVCNACKLYTYAAGTLTPLTAYSTSSGTTHANPVVLDSLGRTTIYLSSSSYRFILKTSADVQIWDQDNIQVLGTLLSAALGGTGLNTSGSSGIPSIAAGTWSINAVTANGVMYGGGSSNPAFTSVGAANSVLTANGAAPSFSATPRLTRLGLGAAADASAQLSLGGSFLHGLSNARIGINTLNPDVTNNNSIVPTIVVSGDGASATPGMQTVRHTTPGAGGAFNILSSTRGSDANTYTILQSGDGIGTLSFSGADGVQQVQSAQIAAVVSGTPGVNDMPTDLVFRTAADGALATERMRLTQDSKLRFINNHPVVWRNVGGSANITALNVNASDQVVLGADVTQLLIYGNEVTPPAAPSTNTGVIYFEDTGGGKTRLVVRFATGAVQTIATEP